jgi:DnaJ-class molecular chaperone
MSYLPFRDQKSFMNYFRQSPSAETASLYKKLCDEEFGELQEAWNNHVAAPSDETVAEIADACIDLIYVAAGLMHGLNLDPQPLWDEVHRSNIDKIKHPCVTCLCTGSVQNDLSSAETFGILVTEQCPDCKGQGFVYEVRRREDGKVLKPLNWNPPALLPIVQLLLSAPKAGE